MSNDQFNVTLNGRRRYPWYDHNLGRDRLVLIREDVDRDLQVLFDALHDEAQRQGLCGVYEEVIESMNSEVSTFEVGPRTTEHQIRLTVRVPRVHGNNAVGVIREALHEDGRIQVSAVEFA